MSLKGKPGDASDAADDRGMPTYLALARTLEEDIRSGRFPPGSKLPVQRDLAAKMGISLNTVTRAYKELRQRNLTVGDGRKGTIVTGSGLQQLPRHHEKGTRAHAIDLTINSPASDEFLVQLSRSLREMQRDPRFDELKDYQAPHGPAWARQAALRWIARNHLKPSIDRIVITSGAQHGLFAVLSSLIRPGDVLVADRLTYYGLKSLSSSLQFNIVGVDYDSDGLRADEFEAACQKYRVKALFTVPCLHNPTVITMSAERRARIVAIASKYNVHIIEDDVYGPMLGERPPPFARLCPQLTYYISSASKALAPGLRLGYVVTPPGRDATVAEAVRMTSWMPSPLSTLIMTRWLEDGTAWTILEAQRRELRTRHGLTVDILNGAEFRSHPACMFVWLQLPSPWRADDFAANALARGVSVMPSSAFAVDRGESEHAVRINFGCATDQDELRSALSIIRDVLHDRPRPLFGSV